MSDPPRWLDDPDQLDDKELSVLITGRDAAPRATLRGEVWTKLAVRLPIAATVTKAAAAAPHAGTAGVAGSAGTASVATAGLSAIVKAVAVGATAGSLVMGGVALTSSPKPSPAASSAPVRAKALAPASPTRAPRNASRVSTVPSTGDDVSAPAEDLEAPRPDDGNATAQDGARRHDARVASTPDVASSSRRAERARAVDESGSVGSDANTREESRLVASARERLRAHDIAGAERELERVGALFPGGVLIQEREALWVEALAARGRTEQAYARAAAFLRAYPKSAHAARVRAIVGW
jgi:hypothetical protein